MATPEKETIVSEISEIFEKAKSVFVTDFKGLNVELMIELRQKCREASVSYRVVKNTLSQLAAKKVKWGEIVDYLQGPSAIAYSYDDPSAPARVISEFAKKVEKPTIKMAIFEGNFYGPKNVEEIASLPSKSVLLAQFVGGIQSPIQGLVSGLNGLLQKMVITLNAVRGVKEKT